MDRQKGGEGVRVALHYIITTNHGTGISSGTLEWHRVAFWKYHYYEGKVRGRQNVGPELTAFQLALSLRGVADLHRGQQDGLRYRCL